jgi:hypothetical protein
MKIVEFSQYQYYSDFLKLLFWIEDLNCLMWKLTIDHSNNN